MTDGELVIPAAGYQVGSGQVFACEFDCRFINLGTDGGFFGGSPGTYAFGAAAGYSGDFMFTNGGSGSALAGPF